MPDSDILSVFDEKREAFKPYGLTCELWTPGLMKKPDRHNEIELNYFPEGTITYLFQGTRLTIPERKLSVFWALIPHQIVHYSEATPYFVCTIPFSLFLEWKLPSPFVERVLRGKLLIDCSDEFSTYDQFLFNNWLNFKNDKDANDATLLEIRARLHRMALTERHHEQVNRVPVNLTNVNIVEKIAIYVAQNYASSITVSNIGNAMGLHPDYANTIFKKAFGSTLSDYITAERISHAQRKLLTTETSITEIAFESGFNSIGRFNAAFRKINGCTPREFKKRYDQSF
jgi:AraC family transcriptional regulator, melibiose operon regulatory protein